ncbi:MAG: redoxin family protein [Verrucomicrobia bacterium]|nr:redoxin family protein [Verrucomicrobiota bacterium]
MRTPAPLVVSCFASLLLPVAALAAELGKAAAPLKIAEWIKGQPVDLAAGKGKTIYVVEFWATWCPPCRTSIPHLTELQRKFKDRGVVFVGVSDEKAATVKKFVDQMGAKMDYVVAVDDQRKTSAAYMEAYGIDGIPHAFVIDKLGKIVWHGHPMGELERTLEAVIAGKFDAGAATKRAAAQGKLQEFFALLSSGGSEARVESLGKELEALDKELGGFLPGGRKFDFAEIQRTLQFKSLVGRYQEAMLQGEDSTAETLAKQIEGVAPKDFNVAEFKETMLLDTLWQRYYESVTRKFDEANAAELAKKLAALQTKNAEPLNEFAWLILTDKKVKKRDLDLALKLARSAHDLSDGKDPAIIDTYARALFESGHAPDAIKYQKKAIELAKEADLRENLEGTLQKYEKKAGGK